MTWQFSAGDEQAMRRVKAQYLRRVADYYNGDVWSAELLFGELVGNAIRHVGGDVSVSLYERDGAAIIGVADQKPMLPQSRIAGDDLSESGRGFELVHALSKRTLIRLESKGKEIIAEIPSRAC